MQILRVMWEQQFRTGKNGKLILKEAADLPPSAERVHSPYDADARYSAKGRGTGEDLEWVGTKVHLTESCDSDLPHLVTDVHTAPATDPDLTATTIIQDKLIARGLAPGQHLMDAGYPSAANITGSALRGITLVAPITVLTGRNAKAGTFTPSDFQIDWATGTARCPAGATSRSMRPDPRGLITFSFFRRHCTPCSIRTQCTLAALPMVRRITAHPEPVHQARMTAHRAQDTDQWQHTYNAPAGIEGTISQAV